MSQFKITNLTNGTLSFAAGSTLNPGQNRVVDIISLELQRLKAAGFVMITELPADPTVPEDLSADYEPNVQPPTLPTPPTFTKASLIDLIQNDADVRAALLAAVI